MQPDIETQSYPMFGAVERELRHDLGRVIVEGLRFECATSLYDCFAR